MTKEQEVYTALGGEPYCESCLCTDSHWLVEQEDGTWLCAKASLAPGEGLDASISCDKSLTPSEASSSEDNWAESQWDSSHVAPLTARWMHRSGKWRAERRVFADHGTWNFLIRRVRND